MEELCEACGHPNKRGAPFCEACGNFLSWVGSHTDEDDDTPQNADPAATESAPPASGTGPAGTTETAASAAAPSRPTAPVAPPAEPPCPRCGTPNPVGQRFCRKCAHVLTGAAPTTVAPPATTRQPWWRRWFPSRSSPEAKARAAYRRTLPMPYRIARVLAWLLVLAVPVAAVLIWAEDPVGWVKDKWYDLRGTLETVKDVDASLPPGAPPEPPAFPPDDAVDSTDSAWATRLPAHGHRAACEDGVPAGEPQPIGTLVLTLPDPAEIHEVIVRGGPPSNNAEDMDRFPKEVVVFYAGHCQETTLPNEATDTTLKLEEPLDTEVLRLSILSAYPAEGDEPGLVFISNVRVRARPG